MFVQKFLCFDLKTGIMAFSILALISSCCAAIVHLAYSLSDDDADMAALHTVNLAAHSMDISLMASLFFGAKNEKRLFLLPFLIFGCLSLSILTLVVVIYMFLIPVWIAFLFPLMFVWYVWICILSLYQVLDPRNPNYVPTQIPETTVYVEKYPPQVYYDNKLADSV